MKRYFNFDRIKKGISDFILNNRLFLLFIVLCVLLGLFLHIKTIGGRIVFKQILSDFLIALIIGSFGYLFTNLKNRYKYYLIWLIFLTLMIISNTIYYGFYQSFLSINLLSTASMVGQVNDSLVAKLHIDQFIYLIFPFIFIVFHRYLIKNNYFETIDTSNSKKVFIRMHIIIIAIIVYLVCTFTKTDYSRFVKLWNRESVVHKYGIYVYTINDLIQSVQPRINTLYGYDEAAVTFRNYYACKKEKQKVENEYTNIFKDKNVLFIHAESIQNFLVNLKINGKEVTPNINRIAKEGIYFSKFYPQISIGTSSDTEFTLLTGLMPSSSGTVFVNYFDRTYRGMPEYFTKMGYYTFSMHGNNREYWNRATMHKALGYKDFFAKESFEIPDSTDSMDYIGLGISDKSFFKQAIPILKRIKSEHDKFFGTIITLSNHSPFNDLEKYGEFDVSMDVNITDEDGNEVSVKRDYLENTSIGNYLKSSHYADSAFGELIDELKKENILDNTIIIFYGDHEARLSRASFDRLYNYDGESDSLIEKDDDNYFDVYGYNYDLLKNTPLIIWSNDQEFNLKIESTMGMYDMLPTIANMFGFKEKYSLGNDIFSNNEKIVVFPNGNVLTDKVYYSDSNEEYVAFTDEPIDIEYINDLKKYANTILEVSNGIVKHNLIKREESRIGECIHE